MTFCSSLTTKHRSGTDKRLSDTIQNCVVRAGGELGCEVKVAWNISVDQHPNQSISPLVTYDLTVTVSQDSFMLVWLQEGSSYAMPSSK